MVAAMEQKTPREPMLCEYMPENYFATARGETIFGNDHPLEVDLGCGDGSFLLEMAQHYPQRNFLGVERLLGRVRKVCRKAERLGLSNLKVLRLDSKYTVEWLLETHCVSRLHLLCPDPWPKERHHKRRLVQVSFFKALQRVIQPGGEFCFKTDHPEYFAWVQERAMEFGQFNELEWPEGAFFYPKTDFQVQWEAQGKRIHQLRFQNPSS